MISWVISFLALLCTEWDNFVIILWFGFPIRTVIDLRNIHVVWWWVPLLFLEIVSGYYCDLSFSNVGTHVKIVTVCEEFVLESEVRWWTVRTGWMMNKCRIRRLFMWCIMSIRFSRDYYCSVMLFKNEQKYVFKTF